MADGSKCTRKERDQASARKCLTVNAGGDATMLVRLGGRAHTDRVDEVGNEAPSGRARAGVWSPNAA